MLRVAILALSAKSYGGDSYFQAILPALAHYSGDAEFIILTRDDRYYRLCPEGGKVTFHTCAFPGNRIGIVRVLWEQAVLPRLLAKLGIDVVYTANNVGLLFSPTPCVIAIRNMEPLHAVSPTAPFVLRLRHKALRWVTRLSAQKASRIIAVSGFVRDTLVAQGVPAEKIEIIYHGIDDLSESPSTRSSDITFKGGYVVSVAKFVRYANLTTLFQAFARMRALGYEGDLCFAGGSYDPKYEAEVKTLVHELSIEPYVHFLGYIPRTEVQTMMKQCDVFLFPSTLEACPFTLLEAMRQGAPIVATTARPMPEFCGDAAIYVEPSDAQGFGEAAYRIVSSPELQALLRQRSRTRAQSFRWEDSVRQLVCTLGKAACVS